MSALTVVKAVKAVPPPEAEVFQPLKIYPIRAGSAGTYTIPINVAGGVTTITAWTVSVSSFNLKITDYEPGGAATH
jgi:hypothetical protein